MITAGFRIILQTFRGILQQPQRHVIFPGNLNSKQRHTARYPQVLNEAGETSIFRFY